ncbi:MAG: tetratricopeptide repeat protein [Caenibius sp.]
MALIPTSPQSPEQRQAAQEDVFVREVDDAVRQDQVAQAARRFGIPLAIILVLGLLALGGWLWWKESRESALEQQSEELVRAIDQIGAGNLDTANKALADIAKDEDGAAAAAAQMLQGGIAGQAGDKARAAEIFSGVAGDASVPQPYRDLALIRQVAVSFDSMPPEKVVEQLKPLAVPGNPWFGSAGELVGLAYLKQGKKDLAGPLFATIAKDEEVPPSLRARARQMAGLLGVDAITDVDKIIGPDNAATSVVGGGELQ